jgi:hypothetical protein
MRIIDFQQARAAYDRYDEKVREALEAAAVAHERLVTAAINVATSGPWREWDATIPDGTEMQFDPDSLAACGDPVVVHLIRAADALDELLTDS